MGGGIRRLLAALLALGVVGTGLVAGAPPAATAVPAQSVRIELAGNSQADLNPGLGLGSVSNPEYFRRWRRGSHFRYSFTQLPGGGGPYWVRLSISEVCPKVSSMNVSWGSFDNAVGNPLVSGYQICTQGATAGSARVATLTFGPLSPVSNQLHLDFSAGAGLAVVSTIELGTNATSFFLALPADQSRHRQSPVARYGGGPFETVLGRLGSRYDLDLAPQRLGFRASPLGTWADDLSDLVVAASVGGSTPRALPLTDRYPTFSQVGQSLSLTSVTFSASEPALGLSLTATFRAPFYPQDESVSVPPVFLLDLSVSAPQAVTVYVYRAVPYDASPGDASACTGCQPVALGGATGVRWGSMATFGDQSRVLPGDGGAHHASEAMAVLSPSAGWTARPGPHIDCTTGVLPCFAPAGDPNAYVFRARGRGWTGLTWSPGSSGSSRLALAGVVDDAEVLRTARPNINGGYQFHYRNASVPGLSIDTLEAAVARAGDGSAWVAKSQAFDSTIGPANFDLANPGATDSAKNLMAYALQSYLVNTWWGDLINGSGPAQWYSVWEGTCCFFHSTLDVQYNDEQLMLALWPRLVQMQLDEWPYFEKFDGSGLDYPMHDMGDYDLLDGQAYPFDMPVEESANYILLLYAHWRATGIAPTAFEWSAATRYSRYLASADTNGNGLPDRGTFNTIDQGSPAVLLSKDQIYLGVKAASAAQAMLEMAPVAGLAEVERVALVGLRHKVDQALNEQAWRGDHFAVTLDPSSAITPAERDASSLYANNGLLYLLQGGGNLPIGSDTMDRIKTDLRTATDATMGPAGSVHTSVANNNAWFSQNFWRDDIGLYLGQAWAHGDFVTLVNRYWAQQQDFARRLDGGWWDVVVYGAGVPLGQSFTPAAAAPPVGSSGDFKAAAVNAYGQSLGYYPRGATIFGLLPSVLGVSVNRPDGLLGLVGPPRPGVRAPLFGLADWGAGTVPVGSWGPGGFSVSGSAGLQVINRPPATPSLTLPSSFSPNGDGTADVLAGTASASPASRLSQSIANDRNTRVDIMSGSNVSWDGTFAGVRAEQGPYRACVSADDPDPRTLRMAACTPTGINVTVAEPSRTWFLAEGSTLHGFEEFVLVQNPGNADATVRVTYQTPSGPVPRAPLVVPARSRRTIRVNDDIAADVSTRLDSDQPVVVERAMYIVGPDGERREGHAVLGVTTAQPTWFLAEGSTQYGFDEYVLVQNPQSTPVNVTFTFSVENGGQVETRAVIPPTSRFTLYANSVVTGDISARVDASGPVIVERAMYWGGAARREGAHATTGVPAASRFWFLAEGTTGFGFDEYVLLQNPNAVTATAFIIYDLAGGPVSRAPLRLPPRSRTTLKVNDEVASQDVSTRIVSDQPVIAERAMYFGGPPGPATSRNGGHDTHGTPTPSSVWHVAEGSTAHGFDEYVLLENPGPTPAIVILTSQPDGAPPVTKTVGVQPGSRLTIFANEVWPDQDFSLLVTASSPIVVERSMYFGGDDRRLGGTDTVVAR